MNPFVDEQGAKSQFLFWYDAKEIKENMLYMQEV